MCVRSLNVQYGQGFAIRQEGQAQYAFGAHDLANFATGVGSADPHGAD